MDFNPFGNIWRIEILVQAWKRNFSRLDAFGDLFKATVHNIIVKHVGNTVSFLKKCNYRISISDDDVEVRYDTEVVEKVAKLKRQLCSTVDSRMKDVTLFVLEDGLSLDMKHYSPFLKSSYFNSNKKYKSHYLRTVSKGSLCRAHIRNCNMSLSSYRMPDNTYLRHNFFSPLLYVPARFYGRSRIEGPILKAETDGAKETAFNKNAEPELEKVKIIGCEHYYLKKIVNSVANHESVIGLYSFADKPDKVLVPCKETKGPTRRNEDRSSKSPRTTATSAYKKDRGASTDKRAVPCKGKPIGQSGGYPLDKRMDYPSVKRRCPKCFSAIINEFHTDTGRATEERLAKHRVVAKTSPGGQAVKGVEAVNAAKDAKMSSEAKKLLKDLYVSGQQYNVKKNDRQKPERQKAELDRYSSRSKEIADLPSSATLSKVLSKNNYNMIANYYKQKSKPFSVDSRMWSNYMQTHSYNLMNYDKRLDTMGKFKQTDGTEIDLNGVRPRHSRTPENSNSFLKGFLDRVGRFYHSVVSTLQDGDHYKYLRAEEFMQNWRIGRPDPMGGQRKPTKYDFTIKEAQNKINPCSVREKQACQDKRLCLKIGDPPDRVGAIAMNEALYAGLKKLEFHPDSHAHRLNSAEIGPDSLIRFCCALNKLLQRMGELRSGPEFCPVRSKLDESDGPVNMPGNYGFPIDPENSKELQLFSVNTINKHINKDTYLDVKIRPLNDSMSFNGIKVDDMKVDVCNDKSKSLADKDSRQLTTGSASNPDKCLLLCVKLRIPFTSVGLNDRTTEK